MTRAQLDLRAVLTERAAATLPNAARAAQVHARINAARRRRTRLIAGGSIVGLALAAAVAVIAPELGRGAAPFASTDLATTAPEHRTGGSTTKAYGGDLVVVPDQPARGMPDQAWDGDLIGEATLLVSSPSATQSVSTFTPSSWDLVVSAVCQPALPTGQDVQVLINGHEFTHGTCDSVLTTGLSAGPDHTPDGLRTYWTTHFGVQLGEPSTLGVRVVDENGQQGPNPPLGTTVSAGVYGKTTVPPAAP